jgi:Flp pilus assembly protein TadD
MDAAAYLSDEAVGLVEAGRVGAAIDAFHQAITLAPGAVDIRLNLCVVLRRMGWFDRSEKEAEIACRIAPREPRAHLIRGIAAMGMREYELAQRCFETVLSLDAKHIDGLLNLAHLLSDSADEDGADRLFRRVLALEHERPQALSGLATLAARRMDFDTALPLYDRACSPENPPPMVRWNRALALLTVGRMAEAWPDFEARLDLDGGPSVPKRRFAKPVMARIPENPCRIHVHWEQGFGDTMQFSRYAPMLAARGHQVSFEVPPELVRLFRWSFPKINIVERAADYPCTYGLPEFDEHVPLMNLPGLFGTEPETVPWDGAYLLGDGSAVDDWIGPVGEWQQRMSSLPAPRIGLCWAGESREDLWCRELDRRRSVKLRDLLEAIPYEREFSLVSIQKGKPRDQIINRNENIADFGPALRDWADTAALIANLDMVISVDTAVAHLAAGMGKPVMMLDRADHCWRWPRQGNRTPWYPTMTIYRQEKMGDWSAPLARVTTDLLRC